MQHVLYLAAAAATGYAAAIYTWPAIRTWLIGKEAEIARLKARIGKL